MPRRAVGPTARVYDWLERHPDGAQWDALLTWIEAVAIDPEMCTTTTYVKPGTRREVHVADIPVARTRAVFAVIDTPLWAVNIIRFDDELYAGD